MQAFCKHPNILCDFNENLSTASVIMPAGGMGNSITGQLTIGSAFYSKTLLF